MLWYFLCIYKLGNFDSRYKFKFMNNPMESGTGLSNKRREEEAAKVGNRIEPQNQVVQGQGNH